MRVWTLRDGATLEGFEARWLCVDGTPVADLAATGITGESQFIADACNAAEEEAAIIADRGAVAAATQRFRALELTQTEADAACSLIRQRVHGRAAEWRHPRRYAVSKDGKMVREVTVLEGEAVPLAQGESLGPHPSEIGEQSVYGR